MLHSKKTINRKVKLGSNQISMIRKKKLTPFEKLFMGYSGGKPEPEVIWDEMEPRGKEEW